MKKKVIIVFIVALILAGSGTVYFMSKSAAATSETETIKEVTVKLGTISIDFMADGVSNLPVLNLRFPVGGQLKELYFDIGDEIKQGDVIAKLDDTDYINKINSAQINYEQAVIKLEKTKQASSSQLILEHSKLDSLKTQLDGIDSQYNIMIEIPEAYSREEIEAAKIAQENAKAAYDAEKTAYTLLTGNLDIQLDELTIQQMQYELKAAEDGLKNIIITSPADGIIMSIAQMPGETVSSSADFVVISDYSILGVIAQVSEFDISKIEKGMRVDMEFEALLGQLVKGTVSSIDPLATTDSGGVVSYNVNIALDSDESKLMDGMTCSLSFILKQKENVLIIPNSTVKVIDGEQVVEVIDDAGNIAARTIKTGLTDGTNVEVIEGLTKDETLVIRTK